MFCTACGVEVIQGAKYCHACGSEMVTKTEKQAVIDPVHCDDHSETVSDNNPLKGVGGWLYYLIFMLAVVAPILHLYVVYGDLRDYRSVEALHAIPGFVDAVMVNAVMKMALAGYSIVCSYMLWSVTPYAVLNTKVLLALNILYAFFGTYVVVSFADLPPDVEKALYVGAGKELSGGIFGPIVWLVYLFRSERVRLTYKN